MPLIPPASVARSVSGLSGKERHIGNSPPSAAPAKTNVQRDDKASTVKERLTSNLKQLGKKSQARMFVPDTKEASGAEVHAKSRDRLLEGFPAPSSGESRSKPEQLKKSSTPETRDGREEQVRFTLTLTPEAVLLLQRRNSERRQCSVSRNAGNGGAVSGGASDTRRRRDNASKRLHTATQRQPITQNTRTSTKTNPDDGLGDITSFVKISLLNEQHKYDDVEYEEEQDGGVDERVVLKCTEWLRGLENTPVTVGNGLHAV